MRRICAIAAALVAACVVCAQSAKIKELMREVSRIRQVKWKKTVPTGTMTKEQFKTYMVRQMKKDGLTKRKVEELSRIGVKWGFYPEDFDVYEETLKMLEGSVAAFYDPKSRRVYILKGGGNPLGGMGGPMAQKYNDSVILHELTHALDDQVFRISRHMGVHKRLRDRRNDRIMAGKALMEGSAVTTQFTYMLGQPTNKARPNLGEEFAKQGLQNPAVAGKPEAMRVELMWPYEAGVKFVHALLDKGGQEELNEAFKNPPVSTEQIMHPQEKYFNRDDPTEVKIDEKALGKLLKGWKFLAEDTLGELFTKVFLKKYVGEAEATKAAAGWDGDEYAAYADKKKKVLLVWLTVWDGESDVNEFFEAYRKTVAEKYGVAPRSQTACCGRRPEISWSTRRRGRTGCW